MVVFCVGVCAVVLAHNGGEISVFRTAPLKLLCTHCYESTPYFAQRGGLRVEPALLIAADLDNIGLNKSSVFVRKNGCHEG